MMPDLIMHISDNDLNIKNIPRKKMYQITFSKEVLRLGKIVDSHAFLEEYTKALKKEKLNSFSGYNVLIITPPDFFKSDEETVKSTFDFLGYHNIKFVKEETVLSPNKFAIWLNVNETYTNIHIYVESHKKSIVLQKESIFSSYEEGVKQKIKEILNKYPKIKKIYLFGNYSELKSLQTLLESDTNRLSYTFSDKNIYILVKLEANLQK